MRFHRAEVWKAFPSLPLPTPPAAHTRKSEFHSQPSRNAMTKRTMLRELGLIPRGLQLDESRDPADPSLYPATEEMDGDCATQPTILAALLGGATSQAVGQRGA